LKDIESWKHHETPLNSLGRVTALPEQVDESGEPIPVEDPVDVNPPLDSVKPENWAVRVCPGGAAATSTSVVVVRSLKWPGAVAIAGGRKFVNVYVGNGLSATSKAGPTPPGSGPGLFYSPPLPGAIYTEFFNTMNADNVPLTLTEQIDVRVDPTPPQPDNVDTDE
jgi:radial spoke head protein 4A